MNIILIYIFTLKNYLKLYIYISFKQKNTSGQKKKDKISNSRKKL